MAQTKNANNVEGLEARAKLTEADLLEEQANLLKLREEIEQLEAERAGVSVRKAGSRAEATKKLEAMDKRTTKLRRDIALSEAAVTELEQDLAAAEDALSEAVEAERAVRVEVEARAHRETCLRYEELLAELDARRREVLSSYRELQGAQRAAGLEPQWTDIQHRVAHRTLKRLDLADVPPLMRGVPAPSLATREDEAAAGAGGGGDPT
jgi:chromosome segregation ATPase